MSDSCDFANLRSVCYYKGNYIVEFENHLSGASFFSLSEDLQSMAYFACPDSIFSYEDLFIRRDTLFTLVSHGFWPTMWTRYYDETEQIWKYYTEKEYNEYRFETFYEDERFSVAYSPRILRSGYLLFEEKDSGIKHCFSSRSLEHLLNHGGHYYLIGTFGIDRINDPLVASADSSVYTKQPKCGPYGEHIVQLDADWDYNNTDTCFYSGLLVHDSIYVLGCNDKSTFFVKVENDTVVPAFDFGVKLQLYDYGWSWIPGSSQNRLIRPFFWEKLDGTRYEGFLDINGYDIHAIYIDF